MRELRSRTVVLVSRAHSQLLELSFGILVPTVSVGTRSLGRSASILGRNGWTMGRSRYRIIQNQEPYFLTCTIVNWIPLFADPAIAQIVLDSLDYLQKSGRMQLYAYVIMENHLHLIASAKDLSKELGDFKSYAARKIIDYLQEKHSERLLRELKLHRVPHKIDRTYQVWQEGSHPERIQSLGMLRQKIEYLHMNPVRRGYVDNPVDWRYSSARNYAGRDALLDICSDW